jgi:hypothetical protein
VFRTAASPSPSPSGFAKEFIACGLAGGFGWLNVGTPRRGAGGLIIGRGWLVVAHLDVLWNVEEQARAARAARPGSRFETMRRWSFFGLII